MTSRHPRPGTVLESSGNYGLDFTSAVDANMVGACDFMGNQVKDRLSALRAAIATANTEALRDGLPAMPAMLLQVVLLMWLRTAVNYQHRHGGTSVWGALTALYADGGIRRLYAGFQFAVLQAVLARFGDTAANAGVLRFLGDASPTTRHLPMMVKTGLASFSAALFRILLTPIDTLKTAAQVEGWTRGMAIVAANVKEDGLSALYRGAVAASVATLAGHYPFFLTYNVLVTYLPKSNHSAMQVIRNALIGWCATLCSDCVSNPIRVLKTARQTMPGHLSYSEIVSALLAEEGGSVVRAFFLRGLATKIVVNTVQGITFVVAWRMLIEWWNATCDGEHRKRRHGHTATAEIR
jgi:hypothetical protein